MILTAVSRYSSHVEGILVILNGFEKMIDGISFFFAIIFAAAIIWLLTEIDKNVENTTKWVDKT